LSTSSKLLRVFRSTGGGGSHSHPQPRFKRADIDHWRAHFRPELEAKYEEIERVRRDLSRDSYEDSGGQEVAGKDGGSTGDAAEAAAVAAAAPAATVAAAAPSVP